MKINSLHCDPPEDEPTHAVAQLCVDGRCQWAETTVDAFFGEHPLAAASRLGLLDEREDLAKGVQRSVTVFSSQKAIR